MSKEYKLSDEDFADLKRLSEEARKTPVMALSLKDGLEGRDFASIALERVHAKWGEIANKMGVKYGSIRPGSTDKHFFAEEAPDEAE